MTSSREGSVETRRLDAVVFIAGTGSLVVEICASRLLAPFFGNTTVVWANIIGLILLYLSLGYWLGGRVADRHPRPRVLGLVLLAAALLIAALPFIAHPILTLALHATDALHGGAGAASFFATLALFAIPVTLLGVVSPFAIRLAVTDVANAGTVAGRLYAISTGGSILGTFLSAFVLIPGIGTQRTMVLTALGLGIASVLLLGWRWNVGPVVAMAALLAAPPGLVKDEPDGRVVFEAESQYQFVEVVTNSSGENELKLNEGFGTHSVWRQNSVLTGGEWDMFLVVPKLLTHPVKDVLLIGSAGGTVPRAYHTFYPDAKIDGVEIDPTVTEAGRQFFGLSDNPNLAVFQADGRPFLALTDKKYDVIMVDAYRGRYVPFYHTTEEFFQLARDHLNPGGVIALNVGAFGPELPAAIETTLGSVMPAWRWRPLPLNELILGFQDGAQGAVRPQISGLVPALASLEPLFNREVTQAASNGLHFTDDHAPVEQLTDRGIVEILTHPVSAGDEQYLPTKPN